MRYLIISTNAIGDSYLSASAIKVIKNNDISAEIDFLSTSKCSPILELLPLKNIYFTTTNFLSLLYYAKRIREQKYDYVFSFFPGLVNTFFFLISKGNKKGGYINFIRRSEWYDREQSVKIVGIPSKKLVWLPSDNYLDRIKLPLSVFFDLSINDCFQKKIFDIFIPESKYSDSILIHPFSRSKERMLGNKSLKKLVKYFEKHNKVFVIGQANDFHDLNDSTIQILSNLNFNELVEAILSCKLFIAVDSFPIHIGDAYDVNFIGIFGPTNPKSVLINHHNAIKFSTERVYNLSFEEIFAGINKSLQAKLK